MFERFFNWLLKKLPFTLAILAPNMLWAVLIFTLSSSFARLLANFQDTPTGRVLYVFLQLLNLAVISIYFLEFGFLRIFKIKKWERKESEIVNDNIINGRLKPDLSPEAVSDVYKSLNKLPHIFFVRSVQYLTAIIFLNILADLVNEGSVRNSIVIFGIGATTAFMTLVFGLSIREQVFFPVQRQCKIFLDSKGIRFEEVASSNLKIKANFFIIFMAVGLLAAVFFASFSPRIIFLFFIAILSILIILTRLVFGSIYRALMSLKETAEKLRTGRESFFSPGVLIKK